MYVPHRQMLPSSPLRTSSRVGLGFLSRSALQAVTKPGRAVAAHQAVVLVEGVGHALLAGVEALEGLDRLALAGDGQRGARVDRVAVDDRRCRRRSSPGRRPAWGRSRRGGSAACRAACSAARPCRLAILAVDLERDLDLAREDLRARFLAACASSSAAVAWPVSTAVAAARPDPRRKSRRLWPAGPPVFLGSCSRIERFSLQFDPPRCPLPRRDAERKPVHAAKHRRPAAPAATPSGRSASPGTT